MFVIFNQHSCHSFQNGYIVEAPPSELQACLGRFSLRLNPCDKGKQSSVSLGTYFTGRFLKSPAFLFKITANEIFYLMKCRAHAIHLTRYWPYYGIIFFCNGSPLRAKRFLFPPGLVEIKLRTKKDLNLMLAAIIICPFGFLFVSLETVCRSNLRAKS